MSSKDDDRNAWILQMRNEGATYLEIARACDLSRERIRQIVKEHENLERRSQNLQHISDETRLSNDLIRRWPCSYLIGALGFSKRATTALMRYLESQDMQELSLMELIDLLLPKELSKDPSTIENIPAFRIKYMAIILYTSLVNRLCELELGEAFKAEVNARKATLKSCLKQHNLSRYIKD